MDPLNPLSQSSPDARLYSRLAALESRLALLEQGQTHAYAEATGLIAFNGNGAGFPFSHVDGPKVTFTLERDQYVGVLGSVEAQAGPTGYAMIQLFVDGTSGYWVPGAFAATRSPIWTPVFTIGADTGTSAGWGWGSMAYFWLTAGQHTAEIYYGGTDATAQNLFRNRRLIVAI